eukprot:CAMPEP_0194049628 /NCGR_PEP_ID=MMETSP0009_2-20130614/30796_1 /TAXON_ID=210454 /ORGANISM="Grammatophora oceanica, Strain CCMP 410" /LENGTH=152 /DNA_ID=CAMNT_0038695829 /DNA_START=101 /DNA_END=559 /DNA_ORIENTATION=+
MKPTTAAINSSSEEDIALPPASREQLLDRLQDSLDALSQVQDLTRDIGKFVIKAKLSEQILAPGETLLPTTAPSRKRKRTDDDDDNEENADDTQPPRNDRQASPESLRSAKRMMCLYRQLQRTQALFQAEVEQFMDETEMADIDEAAPVSAE